MKRNVYSINSAYVGVQLEVRIQQNELELWYQNQCVERLARLFGCGKEELLTNGSESAAVKQYLKILHATKHEGLDVVDEIQRGLLSEGQTITAARVLEAIATQKQPPPLNRIKQKTARCTGVQRATTLAPILLAEGTGLEPATPYGAPHFQ